MTKYRELSTVVEAEQVTDAWFDTMNATPTIVMEPYVSMNRAKRYIKITSVRGSVKAFAGDWIIRGRMGEVYVCPGDMFNLMYEAV